MPFRAASGGLRVHACVWLQVSQYCFIGSAGAYEANSTEPMHVEGDARKASAGHVAVEKYLERVGAPFTVFQPLYMYGAHTAKDCEQWFIDRIARGRPVPIPAPGVPLSAVSACWQSEQVRSTADCTHLPVG